MASLLRGNGVAAVVMLGIICATVHLCSSSNHAANSFSFAISSRRNSTGHRQVRVIFNIPEPLRISSNHERGAHVDVEQNTNIVKNRKIVQLISTIVVLESGVLQPGYELVPGLGSYRLHLTPRTWEEALLACEAEGAHLAVLNSPEEAATLKKIFERAPATIPGAGWSHDAFIGFSDLTGQYLTIFGETLKEAGFDTWHPGQPDKPNEHCGGISKSQGKLADLPCGTKLAYFCEFEL